MKRLNSSPVASTFSSTVSPTSESLIRVDMPRDSHLIACLEECLVAVVLGVHMVICDAGNRSRRMVTFMSLRLRMRVWFGCSVL